MNPSLASAHIGQIAISNTAIINLANQIIQSSAEPDTRMAASQIKYHCKHIHDDVDYSFAIFTPPPPAITLN